MKAIRGKRAGPAGLHFVNSVRFSAATTKAIDDWANKNGVESRSEAIRRLVEIGLLAAVTNANTTMQ